eukprot:m.770675 g.770675  ORF g.770675 m.770675 type:complete len:286 (-) comp23241_c0_seq10:1124-1981(-)
MAGILDWVGETLFGDDNADKGEPAPEGAAIEPQEEDVVYPDNMISKEHLYDMFSSFSAMVESEDGKRRLKDAVAEGKAVEDVTSQMQVEIAEKLGLDGNHVTDMFKHVLKVYKDDEVLCEQFIKFCEKESLACDEAELGPEKLQEKLAKIDLEAAAASQHGHDQHGHGAGRPMSSVGMAQQLAMLSQTPEELDATFQMIERNLREVMSSNAQMKDMILSQLSKYGVSARILALMPVFVTYYSGTYMVLGVDFLEKGSFTLGLAKCPEIRMPFPPPWQSCDRDRIS